MIGLQIALTGCIVFLTMVVIRRTLEIKSKWVAIIGLLGVASIPIGLIMGVWLV